VTSKSAGGVREVKRGMSWEGPEATRSYGKVAQIVLVPQVGGEKDETLMPLFDIAMQPLASALDRRYFSQMPERSFVAAMKGIPSDNVFQAEFRSALRESKWGVSKCERFLAQSSTYDEFSDVFVLVLNSLLFSDIYAADVIDEIKLSSIFKSPSLACHACAPSLPLLPALLEGTPLSPPTLRFLIESGFREVISTEFMVHRLVDILSLTRTRARTFLLAEGWILETLAGLEGCSSSLPELERSFTLESAVDAVRVMFEADTLELHHLGFGERTMDAMSTATSSRIFSVNTWGRRKGPAICLHQAFNLDTLGRLRHMSSIFAREHLQAASSSELPPPSIDPTLFNRIQLLIDNGSLAGPAWLDRTNYRAVIVKAFERFHESINQTNLTRFADLSTVNRIRDLLKYHPSPALLLDLQAQCEVTVYAHLGGHVGLRLNEESKIGMKVGALWFNQFNLDEGYQNCKP
jgi:hypothetical protein